MRVYVQRLWQGKQGKEMRKDGRNLDPGGGENLIHRAVSHTRVHIGEREELSFFGGGGDAN